MKKTAREGVLEPSEAFSFSQLARVDYQQDLSFTHEALAGLNNERNPAPK